MGKLKHRTFNADRFLDKFQGQEAILRNFVGLWDGRLGLDAASLDVPRFKEFLVDGDGDGKDDLLESLYMAFDLCTERGHEDLVAACNECGYAPDGNGDLPVECMSLKVRSENEDAFTLAYDRYNLWRAERFTIFRGKSAAGIVDADAASSAFQTKLAEVFKDHKNSDRVLVRHYQEGAYTNFIVYHEKRVKAELIFKGTRTRPKVAPTILRPAQQDFISYNNETGQVEIEAGFEKEETALRKAFAECCLKDEDFFDSPGSADRINLARIAEDDFDMPVDEDHSAFLAELHFNIQQTHGPSFVVRSKNVMETLEKNYLRKRLPGGTIRRAVFKIMFPDDRRGKRIELSGTNKIKFKRATHAEDVFRYLRNWGSSLTETLLHLVLQRLDQIECPVFLHRELERFPDEELGVLRAEGILRETSRATEIPRPNHLPPGGDLIVRRTSKGIFGVADEDDYFDPIPLTEDDIRQYDISLPKLAAAIRRDNGISGSGLENHDGLIPLGQKSVEGIGSLNVYFSILNADQKDFLSRCQRLERSPQSQRIVMLTPRGVALSPEGRRILDASGIIVAALDSAFDQRSFSIDWIGILGVIESLLAEDHPKDRRVFQKQGKTWLAVYDGVPKSIGDSVGMTYICQLLQSGGQDIHAATLRGAGIGKDNTIVFGSAGEVIDDRARREYRERITEIDEELSEAEANNDLARKEKLNEEREVLNEEIARSTGLHGKNREASSDRERARQSVSAAIHRALKAIKKEHEPLWQHLKNALKIGEFLSYQPDQPTSWTT